VTDLTSSMRARSTRSSSTSKKESCRFDEGEELDHEWTRIFTNNSKFMNSFVSVRGQSLVCEFSSSLGVVVVFPLIFLRGFVPS